MTKITVQVIIKSPVAKVWKYYTVPEHIMKWNKASDEWHTPRAKNDLRVGGKFLSRMEAIDGSAGFDFEGIYEKAKPNELIEFSMSDGRKVKVDFTMEDQKTIVKIMFDAEDTNPIEMQKQGWQAILDNFKWYVEECNSC